MFSSLPSTYQTELRRQVWGRIFGSGIQSARNKAGLSIDEVANLTGIEVSEWMAIEEGYVPRETNQLRSMAAALEISFDRILNMVALCREAWEL